MSTDVKYEWEAVEGVGERESFGDWVVLKVNDYWGPLSIDVDEVNSLDDIVKQQVYEFVTAGMKADDELEIQFPPEHEAINGLIGYVETSNEEVDKTVLMEDIDRAAAEGIIAGENGKSTLKDNPYARFNHHLWRSWRLHFVKSRKDLNEASDKPEQPAEPVLTKVEREMLEIDAKLIALNPKVRNAQHLVDSLKDDLKEARSELDELLEEQADLCNELSLINDGGYQHKLPFDDPHPDVEAGKDRPHGTPLMDATAKAVKADPAIKAAIHELGNEEIVGDLALTESMIDKLMDNGFDFIYKLEERIRKANMGNYKWHDGVTGVAKGGATKVEDALEAWRRINPVPNPEDDEPEEVEATAEDADEEPDTIPINNELEWWCSECDHTWPVDGDNDQCPECENETGNQKVGYQGCPDANEHGVIVRNFDDVYIVDEETVKLAISVYKVDQMWLSSVYIDDKITPYAFSNDLDLADNGSTSRDAAIWNEISRLEENEDVPDSLRQAATEYVDMHFKDIPGEYLRCVSCENGYIFNSETEKPCCPFCGAVEHAPAD